MFIKFKVLQGYRIHVKKKITLNNSIITYQSFSEKEPCPPIPTFRYCNLNRNDRTLPQIEIKALREPQITEQGIATLT